MDPIKLATPEQVARIKGDVDSGTVGAVLAMGEDLAVVKQVTELDPVFFDPNSTTSRRLMFIWGIENWLRLNNTAHYYFNVLADNQNEVWRKVVETHGAKPRSKAPEIRYGKQLIEAQVVNSTANDK